MNGIVSSQIFHHKVSNDLTVLKDHYIWYRLHLEFFASNLYVEECSHSSKVVLIIFIRPWLFLNHSLRVLPCFSAVTTQLSHPSNVRVDVIFAMHMHYLTSILLHMFVLELIGEALVSLPEKVISLRILQLW